MRIDCGFVLLQITQPIQLILLSQFRMSEKLNPITTRIVRGSDYSPAFELFARLRKTMTGNNPKLYLVNIDAHKKIGQTLSICSQGIEQKQNSDINQGPKLCQNFAINGRQHLSMLMCIQNLVRFCQLVLKILSETKF